MKIIHWNWFMRNITGLFDKDTGDKKGYRAMSFLWFMIVRDAEDLDNKVLINHESIHYAQQKELLFVFQWLLYLISYGINLLKGYGMEKSYRQNIFEIEAYDNEKDFNYVNNRKFCAWARKKN